MTEHEARGETPGPAIRNDADIAAALDALAALDARLAEPIRIAGPVPLRLRRSGLAGLVGIVLSQQVSKASAEAIHGRLAAEIDCDDPVAILSGADDAYRRAGVSRPKQRTLAAVAQAVHEGRLDLARLALAPRDEAVAAFTALPGIGLWTAECYLLFCGGHPDIYPAGDLALRAAMGHALGLDERPDIKATQAIAAAWTPHRSTAARLMWAYYGTMTGRDAAPDPA